LSDRHTTLPSGILGFPIAPFAQNGKLDENAFAANLNFLLDAEVSSLFIACGSGEYQSLTRSEYQQMIEIALSITDKKVPVFSGVGGQLEQALDLAQLSQDLGVDGYLILPPYLVQGEQEGLYQYYKLIAESTNLQAIIYQRDSVVFQTETLKKLAQIPQVVGFKDGRGIMEQITELKQEIGNELVWMNGLPFAEITQPIYHSLGFQSYSSAISNYIPHISKLFYHAIQQDDRKTITTLYQEVLLPINRVRKKRAGYAVSLIKSGMEIMGLPVGESVRAPLIPVEKEHYQELAAILTHTMDRFPPT
jgi:5-dehydro-4-deoxyglucarate dehydratase